MSGSIGGTTASHNRFGQYFRQRTSPVNPNTARQQAVRNFFATLMSDWSNVLTQAQRDAWNLYGSSVSWLNAVGAEVFLTGAEHYLRSNLPRVQTGDPTVNDGPTIFTLPGADPTFAPTISEASQLISVTFDNTLAWANEDDAMMAITMSQPRSPGRTFIGPPYRFAGAISGDSVTPPTSPTTIATPYAATEGQKVEVLARISRADGRLSQFFRDTVTVAV
jgi:hypothetical protein